MEHEFKLKLDKKWKSSAVELHNYLVELCKNDSSNAEEAVQYCIEKGYMPKRK